MNHFYVVYVGFDAYCLNAFKPGDVKSIADSPENIMDEDIVINVEYEGADLPIPNVGNVQVVPVNLAWEDFELMVSVP